MPNWKKIIVSGSDAALNSLNVTTAFTASGNIYPTSSGLDGEVLKTDGNGNLFFENTTATTISIKNVSGGTIAKGTPCYITGSGTSGNVAGVVPADAGNSALMPAGIIAGITLNNGDEGIGLINGFINGVNTSAFAAGDEVYVAVGGGYTNIAPTGSALVQKLGNVEKVDASNGSGVINGPNATRSVPNINPGYLWVGDSDWVATPTATSSISVASASVATSASYAVSSSFASSVGSISSNITNNTDNRVLTATGGGSINGEANLTFNGSTLAVNGAVSASSLTGSLNIPAGSTLGIGAQTIYPQGSDGFSVNENFNVGSATQTAYHFTSGDSARPSVVFSLARTANFTNMFGVTGSAADNKFVFGAEFGNTDFEWRKSLGVTPVQLQGGTLLASLSRNGNFYALGGFTGSLQGTASYASNSDLLDGLQATSFVLTSQTSSMSVASASVATSASYALTASFALNGGGGAAFPHTGSAIISGSLEVTGSTSIQGALGISQALIERAEITISASGVYTVYSAPTSSYRGIFADYTLVSTSPAGNARAGNVMSILSGSQVRYSETRTSDIGSTAGTTVQVSLNGGNLDLELNVATVTTTWNLVSLVRTI